MNVTANNDCNWSASGYYGSAMQFDAANDYIDISIPLSDTHTFAMWINEDNSDTSGGGLNHPNHWSSIILS